MSLGIYARYNEQQAYIVRKVYMNRRQRYSLRNNDLTYRQNGKRKRYRGRPFFIRDKMFDRRKDYDIKHRLRDRPNYYNISYNERITWLQHNRVQRMYDLPSCIDKKGYVSWCQSGLWHRDRNLPAKIWIDGTQEWWQNGKMIDIMYL